MLRASSGNWGNGHPKNRHLIEYVVICGNGRVANKGNVQDFYLCVKTCDRDDLLFGPGDV